MLFEIIYFYLKLFYWYFQSEQIQQYFNYISVVRFTLLIIHIVGKGKRNEEKESKLYERSESKRDVIER